MRVDKARAGSRRAVFVGRFPRLPKLKRRQVLVTFLWASKEK
jgi:hypothetical protein